MATSVVQNYLISNNAYSNVFSLENIQRILIQAKVTGVYGNYQLWDSATTYPDNYAVSWNGFDWISYVSNTNVEPGTDPATWGLATAGLEMVMQGNNVDGPVVGTPDSASWFTIGSIGPFGPGTFFSQQILMTYYVAKYGRVWFKPTTLPNGLVNAAVTLGG